MKSWRKFLFIIIAYSLTLLHTMVPHQHMQLAAGETISMVQNPACSSLVNFLQFLFSADLGDNHLETFKKSHVADLDLSFASILLFSAFAVLWSLSIIGRYSIPVPDFVERLQQRLLLSASKPLRAPPLFTF